MKTIISLCLGLLCLFQNAYSQELLEKKVTLEYKETSIEDILKDIEKKYAVRFVYPSNIFTGSGKVNVQASNKPLHLVLDEILKNTLISYQQVGRQVVLKRLKAQKTQEKRVIPKTRELVSESENPEIAYLETAPEAEPEALFDEDLPDMDTLQVLTFAEPQIPVSTHPDTLQKNFLTEKKKLKQQYFEKVDSLRAMYGTDYKGDLKYEFNKTMSKLKSTMVAAKDSLFNSSSKKDRKQQLEEEATDDDYIYRPFQISFITPLGTNGLESHKVVNNMSYNILGGYAAGVEGFELGGFANVTLDYVKGGQVAGFINVVQNEVHGVQVAGFTNVNGGFVNGAQVAGFANVVDDNAYAFQASGFANIVSGDVMGGQFAGFMNITGEGVYGHQAAGFMNISGSRMQGVQAAGFMNVGGGNLHGVQAAGFMNVADSITGVQVAGFMNVADKVRGSQIGFINIADTVSGIQLGFFSFSLKGYKRLELWSSDTRYGNIAFRTGNQYFHNILTAGIHPASDGFSWSYGYGLGSEIFLGRKAVMNMDLTAHHINDSKGWTDQLNMLTQLRVNFGYRLSPRASIFAGPELNFMISHLHPENNSTYKSVGQNRMLLDEMSGRTHFTLWPGVSAGIRF